MHVECNKKNKLQVKVVFVEVRVFVFVVPLEIVVVSHIVCVKISNQKAIGLVEAILKV